MMEVRAVSDDTRCASERPNSFFYHSPNDIIS
jgi:hypothetical protein